MSQTGTECVWASSAEFFTEFVNQPYMTAAGLVKMGMSAAGYHLCVKTKEHCSVISRKLHP
jgi:hypothetical protein